MSMEEEYLRASGVGMQRAKDALQNIINQSRSDTDFRNQPANISSVLRDMPEDRAEFVKRNIRPDGSFNSAAQAMLAPYNDGRSEFQRTLNRGRQADPFFDQAYTERFPITSALQNFAGSGGIFGTVGRTIFDKGRQTVADSISGLRKFAQDKGIYPSTQLNTDTGTTAFTSQNNPSLSGFRDSERLGGGIMDNNLVRPAPSMTQTDFLARPEMNQPPRGLETVFIPTIDPRVELQQELDRDRRFNLMTNNIDDILMGPDRPVQGPSSLAFGFPGKFNQGGIASLNNPEYNLLMNASDFDL